MGGHYKYDLFISYSRANFDEVSRFVRLIKERIPTINIWFDITGIESGDEFDEKIINAINNSETIIFAVSENSINSKWTKDEVMYAKNIGRRIIPVLLRNATLTGWFLFKFGRVDCIDSTDQLQVDKLINNICKWHKGKNVESAWVKPPVKPRMGFRLSKQWIMIICGAMLIIAFLSYFLFNSSTNEREQYIPNDSISNDNNYSNYDNYREDYVYDDYDQSNADEIIRQLVNEGNSSCPSVMSSSGLEILSLKMIDNSVVYTYRFLTEVNKGNVNIENLGKDVVLSMLEYFDSEPNPYIHFIEYVLFHGYNIVYIYNDVYGFEVAKVVLTPEDYRLMGVTQTIK